MIDRYFIDKLCHIGRSSYLIVLRLALAAQYNTETILWSHVSIRRIYPFKSSQWWIYLMLLPLLLLFGCGYANIQRFASLKGRIVFVSNRDGNAEIYIMNADGTQQTRLTTNPANDIDPAWSPDGKHIAFVSDRDSIENIYVMNADGTQQTRLTNNPRNTSGDYVPTWSPDGRHIAFVSNRSGKDDVYIMNADGTQQTRLTTNPADDRAPTWSPDGKQIAYSSERDAKADIYTLYVDGGQETRLTTNSTLEWGTAWSPNGQQIAFVMNGGNRMFFLFTLSADIWVMNADGTQQTRLTSARALDFDPNWSADGQYLAFTSERDGNADIYIMNADGTQQTRLTDNPAEDKSPAWSPK